MRGRLAQEPCARCIRSEPDAYYWRDDEYAWHWTCLLCRTQHVADASDALDAMRKASSHLLHTHGHLRVWIQAHNPAHVAAVQLAMPLAVKLRSIAPKGPQS